MTEWLYLLTSNVGFPPPQEVIVTLAALNESGKDAFLLLPNRKAPPMSGAQQGDLVYLCTRRTGDTKLEIRAKATVAAKAFSGPTPEGVAGLFGHNDYRTWLPLDEIVYHGQPLTVEDLGFDIDEKRFAEGQAYVKHVRRVEDRKPPLSPAIAKSPIINPPSTAASPRPPIHFAQGIFLGIDLTAGSWESGMDRGDKPFPCVRIEATGSGLLHLTGASSFSDLSSLLDHPWLREASVIAIDGPVRLCGSRVNATRTGFEYDNPQTRPAELALVKMGIQLFWTTQTTLENFDGAARWIARSLILFDEIARSEAIKAETIEIHPHGVFYILNGWLFENSALPKKTKLAGRTRRIEILRQYITGLLDSSLPDHDHVDACGAALMAALHGSGQSQGVGEESKGGRIWIPKVCDN